METTHSKRYEIRLKKKAKRSQHVVEEQTDVHCTDNVTRHLAICNSGLVNGLSEETVFEHFNKYGTLEEIRMIPGKSCAFLSYKSPESASAAFHNIHGKLNIAQNNKPVYLSFVENLPLSPNGNYPLPIGMEVLENFITEEEEVILLKLASFEDESLGNLKHRQVKHYGYEFRYDTNNVDKDKPLPEKIPSACDFLWKRVKVLSSFPNFEPNQLTINKYKPGQGIPFHIDTHSAFEDPIMSLSLGSSYIMDFQKDNVSVPVLLTQRSLLIMSGECRYSWKHGITPRKMDVIPTKTGVTVGLRGTRVSYTFRKVLRGECNCKYVDKCDSSLKNQVQENLAIELENTHVHEIYENIADHFSNTRHKPWPNVVDFIDSFEVGSILLDVGCGNGKYLSCNKEIFKVGCDSSPSLINICKERGLQAFTCNCLQVPFRNETVDGSISIAVIHHLATSKRRMQAIEELVRVLKINGRVLIYVWAKNQCRGDKKTTYLKQDRKNRKGSTVDEINVESVSVTQNNISLPVHTNRRQFQHRDVLVPWKLNGKNSNDSAKSFLRFYHVFEEGELEAMCKKLNNIEIVKSYYDEGNWCIVLKKIRV